MTVKEYIDKLSKFNPDAIIFNVIFDEYDCELGEGIINDIERAELSNKVYITLKVRG